MRFAARPWRSQPEDRYATPLELADDVEHWLADEPVAAYAEPVRARLRRWLRKRPKRVTAAVVLLLATVVGLTVGRLLIGEQSARGAGEFRGCAARTPWTLSDEA